MAVEEVSSGNKLVMQVSHFDGIGMFQPERADFGDVFHVAIPLGRSSLSISGITSSRRVLPRVNC